MLRRIGQNQLPPRNNFSHEASKFTDDPLAGDMFYNVRNLSSAAAKSTQGIIFAKQSNVNIDDELPIYTGGPINPANKFPAT